MEAMAETSDGPPAPSLLPELPEPLLPEPLPPSPNGNENPPELPELPELPPKGKLPEPPLLPDPPVVGVVLPAAEFTGWPEDDTMRLTPAPASAAAAITRTAAAERRPLERRDGPVGPAFGGCWPYGGCP